MKLLFLDFETYYDKTYSLRKLTPPEYILASEYETICCSYAFDAGPVGLCDGPDVGALLAGIDPSATITVTYNALFDNCILAWRYGFLPWQMVDALGMARCLLGSRLRSLSLESVAAHLGVGVKGETIKTVLGMRRADIMADPYLWGAFKAYCMNDTEMLRKIFFKLQPDFPQKEWPVMDLTLRAAVQPRFHTNVELLKTHGAELRAAKEALLTRAQVEGEYQAQKDEVLGAQSFLDLLKARSVEIEMKEGKRGPIPAIAKTDDFMVSLQEHEDPIVQALAAARLGLKSTLEESRTDRLISIASAFNSSFKLPVMPIPLRYAGARTHRFSGEWKINAQNFPRGSKLRQALVAPPGRSVIVGDLSQIEARMVAWLAGADVLLRTFADNGDPYKVMAALIFNVREADVTKFQRFIGKSAVLGLGYGMGATKFYNSVIRTSRTQDGFDKSLLDNWTEDLAQHAVDTYRKVNFPIRNLWARLNIILDNNWRGVNGMGPVRLGPMEIGYARAPGLGEGYGYIEGPTHLQMRYDNPRVAQGELFYNYGGIPCKIYGASALENISQHLAGVLIKGAAVRMAANGYNFAHQVHDELVYIVPTNKLTEVSEMLMKELTAQPFWAPGLPLGAEVKYGLTYGDAK